MIRAVIISGVVLAIAGAAVGAIIAKDGAPASQVAALVRQKSPVVTKPGSGLAAVGAGFLAANPPPAPPVFTPPPPPEIALTFRRELSAVMGSGSDMYLLMKANSVGSAQPLKVGQIYQDGWMLAKLNSSQATLTKKGEESRTIFLFSAAESPDDQSVVSTPTTPTIGTFGSVAAGGGQAGRGGATGTGVGGFTVTAGGRGGAGGTGVGGFTATVAGGGRGGAAPANAGAFGGGARGAQGGGGGRGGGGGGGRGG